MIISNTSSNPEINRRSITNLGDTLGARGDIHAAHFCYVLAQIDFGTYGTPGVKLVLIGSNHHNKCYGDFVTLEAIMLTEIYEYARHLSEPGFTLIDLQSFKFEIARQMLDYGLVEKALLYLEQIAVNIVNDPVKYKPTFINRVFTLGDRIKYHDPVCKDSLEDVTSLAWLNNLAEVIGRCQTGEIVEDAYATQLATETEYRGPLEQQEQQQDIQRTDEPYSFLEGSNSLINVPLPETKHEWQPLSLPGTVQHQYNVHHDPSVQYPGISTLDSTQHHQNQQNQQEYWNPQSYGQQEYQTQDYTTGDWQQQEQTAVDSTQQQGSWNYEVSSIFT